MLREFSIDSRDMKSELTCYAFEPKGDIGAILILVHGMQDHIMRFRELAEYLESEGILCAGVDLLGHGRSAKKEEDFGYFCEQDAATVVVRDVHRLKKTVQAEHQGVPVYIMGHSMGSFIVRNYMTRYGTGIAGVILEGGNDTPPVESAAGKFMSRLLAAVYGWHHRSRFMNNAIVGKYKKAFPGEDDWLSTRKETIEDYKNDPLTQFVFTLNGFYTLSEFTRRAGDTKLMENIPRDLPILIASGEEDPVGEMGRGVRRMYELYRSRGFTDVKLDLRPSDRHELHNETDRYKFYEEIKDFIIKG